MNKSVSYRKAEVLAQQLINHIELDRLSGQILYHDDGEHKVLVEIYAKKELLSEGSVVVSVTHDEDKHLVTASCRPEFKKSVGHIIEEFAGSLESEVSFA